MARKPRATVQLCSAPKDAAVRDSARCVLSQGHPGQHEGFDNAGKRVLFESAPQKPSKPE